MTERSVGGSMKASDKTSAGKHSANATDHLLGIIRQQKLQRQRFCEDPIYAQYLATEKQRACRLRRKGWLEQTARPTMDEDLDSEARQRVTALLSSASRARDGVQAGVWAAFGKPYKTLGQLQQV